MPVCAVLLIGEFIVVRERAKCRGLFVAKLLPIWVYISGVEVRQDVLGTINRRLRSSSLKG
jgi:hypothetical protein